jgi:tetratricopeptide (TPR) repeat protein/predicted Ser/Thr protein kinase
VTGFPAMIGPYQVLKPLGTGGMGEVLLAYDERLDRKVAIKRIRLDTNATPERRERFRREARMAAKLNHPAIVQIYDVLTEEDTSYIVMEHVEGTNLRRLLDDGPLSAAEVAALGRDIAQGLAEAHRLGIVHRDLKSENILVTPDGRAKIADFGIAKRALAGPDEGSLTADGRVLGTYRTMSPEQARGEPVDFRSDLFSLGVLLYEALTGQSPFEAENELAMLSRIVRDRQIPVREVRPELAGELSDLVDHLLEKDPLRRPRSAREVADVLTGTAAPSRHDDSPTLAEPLPSHRGVAAEPSDARGMANSESALAEAGARKRLAAALLVVLLLSILGVVAYLSLRSPVTPLYVAVLAPEVKGGSPADTDLLVSAVRSALVQALVSLKEVSPKATEEVAGASGSPVQVARAVAADEVVAARLDCRPEACRITLDRIRGHDGALLWSESFEIPADDAYLASRATATHILRGYSERSVRRGTPKLDVSSRDFSEYLRLRQRFESRKEASLNPILDGLAAIRGRSPGFVDVYLTEAEVARYKFAATRHTEDLDRALDLSRRARDLAPGDPQPLSALFLAALDGGRFEIAEETLDALEKLTPGDVSVLERRAQLLDARGLSREAVQKMQAAVNQRSSWKRLYKLAYLQNKQGETAAARLSLRQLLARSPGNADGLSLLAQIELVNGDPQKAAELYSRIVRNKPGVTELGNLGLAYFLLGRYAEAAEVTERAARQVPGNPMIALNLADSYFLAGRKAEANEAYRRIVLLVDKDPSEATNPQLLTVKGQALAHLGQGPPAVTAAQEAIRLAPDSSSVAYEASLIYAVLHEDNSAVVHAQRALHLGYEPRWFSFPWFAAVRARPEFQSSLRKP